MLRVTAVGEDGEAINVYYEVRPSVPRGTVLYYWTLDGRDNLGNQYRDGGGVQGPSPEGDSTAGVHSVVRLEWLDESTPKPAPAPGASWVDLHFHAFEDLDCDPPRYTLRVHLPIEGE